MTKAAEPPEERALFRGFLAIFCTAGQTVQALLPLQD